MKTYLFLFLNLLFLSSYGQVKDGYFDSLLLNKPAPNFNAKTLNGRAFSLSNHKDKIVMVNFWSLSCGACFKELIDFNRIVKERKNQKFVLISLMEETKEQLASSIEERGEFYKLKRIVHNNDSIEFEIIPNAFKIMKEYYGIEKDFPFPLTVYIDKNGIVRDYLNAYLLSFEGTGQITNYDSHNEIINRLLK